MVESAVLETQLRQTQIQATALKWELDLERRVSHKARVEVLKAVARGKTDADLEIRMLRAEEELAKQRESTERACRLLKKGSALAAKERHALSQEICQLKEAVALLTEDKQRLTEQLEAARQEIVDSKRERELASKAERQAVSRILPWGDEGCAEVGTQAYDVLDEEHSDQQLNDLKGIEELEDLGEHLRELMETMGMLQEPGINTSAIKTTYAKLLEYIEMTKLASTVPCSAEDGKGWQAGPTGNGTVRAENMDQMRMEVNGHIMDMQQQLTRMMGQFQANGASAGNGVSKDAPGPVALSADPETSSTSTSGSEEAAPLSSSRRGWQPSGIPDASESSRKRGADVAADSVGRCDWRDSHHSRIPQFPSPSRIPHRAEMQGLG